MRSAVDQSSAEAEQHEQLGKRKAGEHRERVLQQPGENQDPPTRQQLAQIDLKADEKQQQDQPKLRDGVDVRGVGHEPGAERSGDDTGNKEGGNRRDSEPGAGNCEHAR